MFTDKRLREMANVPRDPATGIPVWRAHVSTANLARDLLARRKRERRLERALRELFRMCEEHRAKETKYVTCGWFGDAEAVLARALGSRPAAKKGGRRV